MVSIVSTVAYLGLEARGVEVQVQLIAGLPAFNVVGLGDKAVGESRERVFDQAGVVVVNCNVHHVMQAQVLVLPTVHHTRPGTDGRYRLVGLPPGPGELHFWHPRAGVQSVKVTLPGTATFDRRIELSKPRAGRRP